MELNWRMWRTLMHKEGQAKLRQTKPEKLSRETSKKIKGAKDFKGKRRGSELN